MERSGPIGYGNHSDEATANASGTSLLEATRPAIVVVAAQTCPKSTMRITREALAHGRVGCAQDRLALKPQSRFGTAMVDARHQQVARAAPESTYDRLPTIHDANG